MKPVIDPVAADLIENELTPERLLRRTNNGGNEIYVMRAQECPNLMREIGRLRELSFRDGGGGTGADVDIDELDLDPEGYEQLFVWDPKAKEIVGGYRYIISRSTHPKCLSTEHYFRFTERFRNEYLPYTIELHFDEERFERMFCGGSYAEDYKILIREIRKYRENIPPLINSYMSLSPSMKVFGTVVNPDFGYVEETGILITISDIYPKKSQRHFRFDR